MEKYEAKQDRIVFPSMLNNNQNLFGGLAMQWMDEVAYITAMKYTKRSMVTVSVNDVKFLNPIKEGSIIEIKGRVKEVSQIKLEVKVEIFASEIQNSNNIRSIEGTYIFACINNKTKKPIRMPNADQ
ncbi:MAG: acyl-CoA thioesterase [Bacteroidales bacterium]